MPDREVAPAVPAGTRRALAVLHMLGEDLARSVRACLPAEARMALAPARLDPPLTGWEVRLAATAFIDALEHRKVAAVEPVGDAPARKVGQPALRVLPSPASAVLDPPAASRADDGPRTAANADASSLARLLVGEHPQVIAVVLASLPDMVAADVLFRLPEPARLAVARRMARLDSVTVDVLSAVFAALDEQLVDPALATRRLDGASRLAEALGVAPKAERESLQAALAVARSDDLRSG